MSDITTPDIKVPPKKPEFAFDPGQEPVPYIDLTPKKPKPPEDTTISTTSPENRDKADSAKYRSMLEELYAVEEPSNWEEAQKWFAMSAQIMNPDANLMQGLVNAGAVYSQAEAEQAAAQREADLDLRKALLQYDIGERDYAREVAANKAEAAAEFLKTRTNVATGQLDDLYRQQREVAEQIRRIDESVMKGETDPASVEGIKKALQQQFNAIGGKLSTYEGFIGETYGFPTIPTVNLQTGKIE
jgi:hypothetical protein